MALTNKKISEAYKDLIDLDNSNSGISSFGTTIKDGAGKSSAMTLGENRVIIRPTNADSAILFQIRALSGTTLFYIDGLNEKVYIGKNQLQVNFASHTFSLYDEQPSAGVWYPLISYPTGGVSYSAGSWGSGAAPDSSLTISGTSETYMPFLFYVPHDISLQSCTALMTADSSTTVDIALMRYDMVLGTGSTAGDLSNGTNVLNGGVQTCNPNADRIIKEDCNISASETEVTQGQVLIPFIKQDTVTHDLSGNMYLTYNFR